MNKVRFLQLIIVYVLLLARPISSQKSLNEVFEKSCQLTNCTLHLLEREYIITAPIKVSNLKTFKIIAPSHTTIRCQMSSNEKNVITIDHTDYVVFESISFVNCSHPVDISSLSERIYFTSIVEFINCHSVVMNLCYFPDFSQLAVVLRNTNSVGLTNSYFKANPSGSYARAITYKMRYHMNVSFNAHNITVDGCRLFYPNISLYIHLVHLFIGGGMGLFIPKADHVKIYINDSRFINSKALEGGGLIMEMWDDVSIYDIDISGCHFENNAAYQQKRLSKGGALAIRAFGHRGYARIKNCRFVNNQAQHGGALAVLLYERVNLIFNVDISDSGFMNNSADKESGGAIYAENLYMTNRNCIRIKNSTFINNEANSGGAILGINFRIKLEDNVTIKNNTAYYGGGVCLLGSGLIFSGSNISIEGNHAMHSGGALYLHSSSWVYPNGTQTLIRDNTANLRGGAIFVYSDYYENTEIGGWEDKLYSQFSCFLQKGMKLDSLVFTNNYAHMGKLCMGYNVYTVTSGNCDIWNHLATLQPKTITFKDRPNNNCSITQDIDHYDKNISLKSPCKIHVNPESLHDLSWKDIHCDRTVEIKSLYSYHIGIINTIKRNAPYIIERLNETLHIFFPGYESNIRINSFDSLGNPIETLTEVVFTPINSTNKDNDSQTLAVAKSGITKSFTINEVSKEFVFGKICLQSHATLNQVTSCNLAIIGSCPNPLICGDQHIRFSGKKLRIKNGTKLSGKRLYVRPGMLLNYINGSRPEYILTHCTWVQCRCHTAANLEHCHVNINAPETQCQKGLTSPFCSKCSNENERISPQFSWVCVNSTCFECTLPYLMIFLYVIITLGITVLICVLGVDVFSDYTRSIAFYSSTLYILYVSGENFENHFVYHMLSVPIVIINLLVTQMYPFCLPVAGLLFMGIFEMVAPFLFIIYIFIMIILVKYVPYFSKLGKYDLVNKIWTIIILTYSHICNQAFNILNCAQDSNQKFRWLFDAEIVCLRDKHLFASIIAILLLFILVTFPNFMFFFSHSKNPEHRSFVMIYEERYKVGYKQWEMLKLYLRVLFPLIVSLLPNVFLQMTISFSLISIICLFLMLLNSLLQPATSKKANYFESICLAILAFTGLQRREKGYMFIAFIPYIIYLIYIAIRIWIKGRELYLKIFKSRKS